MSFSGYNQMRGLTKSIPILFGCQQPNAFHQLIFFKLQETIFCLASVSCYSKTTTVTYFIHIF